jgi:riboflavin kinase/FMN adenylyltransferase
MIVCGADFRFGKFAVAGVEQLQVFCAEQGIEFCALPLLKDDKGRKIGTFGIREALVDGDMPRVETYLGRCYTLEGTVEHGRADGKRLGFPTANFQLDSHYQSPAMGVYACAVWVDDRWYAGVCNLGAHPTLGDMSVNVECHLLHYSGDLYGRKIRVRLHRKLRDIRRFESEEALHAQIKKDCMMAEYVYGGIYD